MSRLPLVARYLRAVRYRFQIARGKSAGELRYRTQSGRPSDDWGVTVCSNLDQQDVQMWVQSQTLKNVEITSQNSPERGWFLAPATVLPTVPPGWLQSALLVAATEQIDALAMAERIKDPPGLSPSSTDQLLNDPWRSITLFSGKAFRWDPKANKVRPREKHLVTKIIGPGGVGSDPPKTVSASMMRRGPYLCNRRAPATLEIGIADRLSVEASDELRSRPNVLVTAPFLARGGAEHTLFETLAILNTSCHLAFATLAPHRPELHDRRADFESLSPHIFSLGDWVHPDAMMPMLLYLIDSLQIDVLYNANGTTLFYEFAPQLKAARPKLKIVDHLYDHRIGYIERYRDPNLLQAIDSCVAENFPIAEILTDQHGWSPERVPVIWSCGRAPRDIPPADTWDTIRQDLRRKFGYTTDDVVFLTAARMHEQKRPLDLVRLAEAVADRQDIHFLIVGGGPMEDTVDRAIRETPTAQITRLPFRTDIPQLILAADAGLLVSDFEGLPVFLLECLQLGRPFLGTDIGDLGRVIRDTKAGLVVENPGDIEALAKSIRSLADLAIRREFGANALQGGRQFSPTNCAHRYGRALFGEDWAPSR